MYVNAAVGPSFVGNQIQPPYNIYAPALLSGIVVTKKVTITTRYNCI